jgi:hypothetical protein
MDKGYLMKIHLLLATLVLTFGISTSANAAIAVFDYGFNIDGTVSVPTLGDAVPAAVDISGFDDLTGLGTIEVTIIGAGSHSFDAFFDHEIDEPTNSLFNELGSSSGSAAARQSWEIDEPGFFEGDIFLNFENSALDNGIGTSVFGGTVFPDDVSMAMGWDFILALGESATIMMALGTVAPADFYLEHSDPDSNQSIFLSSRLDISPIPVPGAIWLFGAGLFGLFGMSPGKFKNT